MIRGYGGIRMTISEGINYFEEIIADCKKSIEAEDGLPGLYYDGERIKSLKKSIEIYQQFIDWLEELEQHRRFFEIIKDIIYEAADCIDVQKELNELRKRTENE